MVRPRQLASDLPARARPQHSLPRHQVNVNHFPLPERSSLSWIQMGVCVEGSRQGQKAASAVPLPAQCLALCFLGLSSPNLPAQDSRLAFPDASSPHSPNGCKFYLPQGPLTGSSSWGQHLRSLWQAAYGRLQFWPQCVSFSSFYFFKMRV